MARTMDEMKDGAGSWAHEIKTYEMEKRRVLDEGFLRPPAMKLTAGQMKSQERVYDPLLQRYRCHETEYKQRVMEETERVNHLNRAMDIQVIREQPFHILHHESKFDAIAPGKDPLRQPGQERQSVGKGTMPDSQQDYNIISNLGFETHHWNRPEARPRCIERSGTQRKVHANRVRDFNIVNNRYPVNHEGRVKKEKELEITEATHKYMTSNRFDPVVQQYNDPKDEAKAIHCDDAREVEVHMRAENQIPPAYKGRHTQFYDAISNEVHDPDMVRYLSTMEAERKDRYRNRYIVEHNFHAQDIKGDHLREARKLNKVAPERFLEHDRGYDITTNKKFGNGPKEQVHYSVGYPQPRKTPWEEIEHSHAIHGRSSSTPVLPSAAAAEVQHRSEAPAPARSRSSRSHARHSSREQPGETRDGAATPAASQRSHGSQARSQASQAPSLAASMPRSQASQARSQVSQRSLRLSEAGGRAMSQSGSTTSAAMLREPPGATRPIRRVASTPALGLSPVPEMAASAVMTRKLPPPESLGGSLGLTRAAPPAPAIPGSPMGSVYSRPSGSMAY